MLKNKELEMYDNMIKNIVKNSGGFREKDIMENPHIIKKTETWNKKKECIRCLWR